MREMKENDFIEVDNNNLPKEWQEAEQIKIDTGENDKEKLQLCNLVTCNRDFKTLRIRLVEMEV